MSLSKARPWQGQERSRPSLPGARWRRSEHRGQAFCPGWPFPGHPRLKRHAVRAAALATPPPHTPVRGEAPLLEAHSVNTTWAPPASKASAGQGGRADPGRLDTVWLPRGRDCARGGVTDPAMS